MDTLFFRSFFITNEKLTKLIETTPTEFDESTPVIIAEFSGTQASGMLAVTKTRGGNKYSTVYLAALMVIFYPTKGQAKLWMSV